MRSGPASLRAAGLTRPRAAATAGAVFLPEPREDVQEQRQAAVKGRTVCLPTPAGNKRHLKSERTEFPQWDRAENGIRLKCFERRKSSRVRMWHAVKFREKKNPKDN